MRVFANGSHGIFDQGIRSGIDALQPSPVLHLDHELSAIHENLTQRKMLASRVDLVGAWASRPKLCIRSLSDL